MENNPMQPITQWHQMKPLATKIIAYTTSSPSLAHGVSNNHTINYGYISDYVWIYTEKPTPYCDGVNKNSTGYVLRQLLAPNNTRSNKVIDNAALATALLQIRSVTPQDATIILNALTSNQMSFEYLSINDTKRLVAHLQDLTQ
jgi:hypothetical protein